MRNTSLSLVLFVILFFTACQKVVKDVNDYYPEVRTTGAVLLPDGSVQVTGEIVSEGNTPIHYIGFCMDTLPHPRMLSNQKSLDTIYGNMFTTVYSSLSIAHKYYFRAWVANAKGYAIGDDVSVDSVTISSSTVPCTLPPDTITMDNTHSVKKEKYFDIDPIEQQTTGWNLRAYSNAYTIDISFSGKPVNGVYKTWENTADDNTALIMVNNMFVDNGASVYVKEITANTIELTICEATFFDGAFNNTFSTRFRASY